MTGVARDAVNKVVLRIGRRLVVIGALIPTASHASAPEEVWLERAKLEASDWERGDAFGRALSLSGDVAIFAAPWADDVGSTSGAAYVFGRSAGQWQQQQKLLASDASELGGFGQAVASSGATAVVGSAARGTVYVFANGASWTEQQRLRVSNGALDRFGSALAILDDVILVGAPERAFDSGAVFVFSRVGTSWSQLVELHPASPAFGAFFGSSVAMKPDALFVGAPGTTEIEGAVYAYDRDPDRAEVQEIVPTVTPSPGARFGRDVAVDGATLVVGAPGENGVGAAYIFVQTEDGWVEQAKLVASDGASEDYFGAAVDVHGDWAIVGAYGDDDRGLWTGSAYLFKRSGSTWMEVSKLLASDALDQTLFGYRVALDGQTAIATAYGRRGGAAYVFEPAATVASSVPAGGQPKWLLAVTLLALGVPRRRVANQG